jgi:hypothetical protein
MHLLHIRQPHLSFRFHQSKVDGFFVDEKDWIQRPKEDRFDEGETAWSDEEDEAQRTPSAASASFPELEKQIEQTIKELVCQCIKERPTIVVLV